MLYETRAQKSEAFSKILTLCQTHGIPFISDDKTLARLAPSENTFVMTVFNKHTTPLNPQTNHIVLVSPSDMGNLGTIFRTALGFGIRDIALIQPCADHYDPRAIRASMGAVFALRINRLPNFEAYQHQFPHHSQYPMMTDGAIRLREVTFQSPYTIIFGNESAGLPPEYQQKGQSVKIPHTTAIDSLNLAVALGIVLYHSAETSN